HRTNRRPEENCEDDESAHNHPTRVAARVAGLRVAHAITDGGCALCDAVYRAVYSFDVQDFPEDVIGYPDQRPNHRRSVKLVDVILVRERGVGALESLGELFGLAWLLEVEPEGRQQSDSCGDNCDASEH